MTAPRSVGRPRLLQTLGVGSVVYGALLTVAPRQVVAALARSRPSPPTSIIRVLGVRQIGQGVLLLVRPLPGPAVAGAAVDALHALTMVAAAVRWPGYRPVCSASAVIAVASSAVGAYSLRP